MVLPFVPVTPTTAQRGRGVPVEAGGGGRHRGAHVLDLDLRHAGVDRPRDDQRRGAARHRVGREVVPVAREPGHAEEQGAGLHRAVVVGQAADLDRRPIAEQVSDGHPRAVYERPRRLRCAACRSSTAPTDAASCWTPRARRSAATTTSERHGEVYADLFEREPGVSAEHAAAAILADLRGMRIAGDEALGRELVAAGGEPLRHAHLMSHDLVRAPRRCPSRPATA